MPSDAEQNAALAAVCATENYELVARDGLEQLGAFTPIRFEAPPSWLESAIDQARRLGREGNPQAARQVVQNIVGAHDTAVGLGKYREHVTWAEAENARKLGQLAWTWNTLREHAREDVATDRKLELLERFAHEHYGVTELRTERGWAEQQTRVMAILPRAWRNA